MNRKKNKQYLETDQRIQECLLELANENVVPTISEICRRCSINRTTFYLHYVDIVELLGKIQEQIFHQFMESTEMSEQKVTFMSYQSYLLFTRHVFSNQSFYRLFFRLNTEFPLKPRFEPMWSNIIRPYFLEHGIHDENVMLLRFVAYQSGFTISLRKWVEQGCKVSCEEMATILTECIHV